MECLSGVFDIDAGKLVAKELERILTQARRDGFGKNLHALARELSRHVADVELDQQVAHFCLFDNFPDAPVNRFGASDDNRLRSVQLFPVLDITQELAAGLVAFQIFPPCRRWNVRHAGTECQLSSLAPEMAFEAIFQEIPNAFFTFFARLLIRLRYVS